MKKTIFKTAILIASVSLFTACVNGDDYDTPSLECNETSLVKNLEVSAIPFSSTITQYTNEDIVEAYVTSSDRDGNFFKSISMQTLDGSDAFSISVDVNATFVNFEPGRKVLLNLKDLYLLNNVSGFGNGGKVIGSLYISPTNGSVSIGRIPQAQYLTALNRSCTVVDEDQLVQTVTIAQATSSDAYLNKLIEIENVQFNNSSINTTYYDQYNAIGGSTNHTIEDADGNSMIFRTSSYATFAHHNVAEGNGKIRGVITKYGNDYQFFARYESDIMLDNPRIVPLFEESFTSNWNNWTKYSVVGAQVWTLDTQYGNPGNCAKMSGYSGGNQNNEDWLISPSIDLTSITSASLKFDTSSKFAGNLLEVYISTDYVSGDPNTATWTQLSGFALDTNTGSYIWTASGAIDISTFAGNNIYIGFKYTSTTSAATTWEVDNVKIEGQ